MMGTYTMHLIDHLELITIYGTEDKTAYTKNKLVIKFLINFNKYKYQ